MRLIKYFGFPPLLGEGEKRMKDEETDLIPTSLSLGRLEGVVEARLGPEVSLRGNQKD